MKYSIIIPHKDTFLELERLLASIPDSKNIEVIVVDDGSDAEKLNDFKKKKIGSNKKIIEAKGRGAGNARNEGIANSSGKWLIFADSDDMFNQFFLDILEKNCDNNLDLIIFFPQTKKMPLNDYRENYKSIFYEYFKNPTEKNKWIIRLNFDVPWSKAVKREYVLDKEIKFDNTKKQNDTMFSHKIALNTDKILVTSDSIYTAIYRLNSISSQKSKEVFEDAVQVRINSYIYKYKNFSNKELFHLDYNVFINPLTTIWESYRIYGDIKYSHYIYSKYKKSKISILSVYVIKGYILRLLEKNKKSRREI